ncbi:MAG: hypothetical protein ACREOC_19375 [Gemmatimonadales bacterium]
MFNVEMFYDQRTGRIHVIEVNPRMCGQFADLMEMVNGTNTYEILLALAVGERPRVQRRKGPFTVAASFPLRAFRDMKVLRVPGKERIEAVCRAFPVTLVKAYYKEGQLLSEREDQCDGASYRYAVVNMASHDRETLLADFAEVQRRLGFAFRFGEYFDSEAHAEEYVGVRSRRCAHGGAAFPIASADCSIC